MHGLRRIGALVVGLSLGLALPLGCGTSPRQDLEPEDQTPAPLTDPDGGSLPPPVDAGEEADSGAPPPDAGTSEEPDAGPPPLTIELPSIPDWQFFGPQHGGPQEVWGATIDDGGNVWVAGGEEGLFLLTPGATTLRRFTMADGLRPYGYMPGGEDPPGEPFFKVISVSGGPAGTVFVGYEGKPVAPGVPDCESSWDSPNPDPSVYKSGDADKVTLDGSGGIRVVHYDIFSGPNVINSYPRGREKLCHVERILYDRQNHSVWFGANHGFAWGDPDFEGDPTCNGQRRCEGILEHVHPAINAWRDEQRTKMILLTGTYRGIAVDPLTGDVWFGGSTRSTRFKYGSNNRDFWTAMALTEGSGNIDNHLDIWPDAVTEPAAPTPSERKDDSVSAMAAMADGTVWASSYYWGIAQLDASGRPIRYLTRAEGLIDDHVFSLVTDPSDGSLWIGAGWGGINRLKPDDELLRYDEPIFGRPLIEQQVRDLQVGTIDGKRAVIAAFSGTRTRAGAIGIYTGP